MPQPETRPASPDPQHLWPPLLAWYGANGRSLPWRGDPDPYRIWVSEIMLQQTRVETVRRYYDAFLERFPTVQALADAPEEEVRSAWSGLGFYRRCRNLQKAARVVVEEHGGEVPRDPETLLSLPGLGRYTVGAILSATLDLRLPILDGNVQRVLSRVFRVGGNPKSSAVRRRLWALAEALLPDQGAGDVNQALMDLGATVCTPKVARCDRCPWAELCGAHARREELRFPEPPPRQRVVTVERVALHLTRPDGAVLLVQRPAGGLLASLWELPALESSPGDDPGTLASRLAQRLGGAGVRPAGRAEHRFSHRHWSVRIYVAELEEGAQGSDWDTAQRWVREEELEELGVPTATRKMLAAAGEPGQGELPL